jgi:glycosyltransferase involved in cell wall biosynthesis
MYVVNFRRILQYLLASLCEIQHRYGEGIAISTRLTITFLLPGPPTVPVGGFRVVYTYANHLAARGHHVNIVHAGRLGQFRAPEPTSLKALRKGWRYWSRIRPAIVPPHIDWHHFHPAVTLRYLTGEPIARTIPSGDIVVATAWTTAEYLHNYPTRVGLPFYLIQHVETWQGDQDRVWATWHYPFHKIVVSHWLQEQGRLHGIEGIQHIPIAVDHALFYPPTPIVRRTPGILAVYSPIPWKGPREVAAVIQQVRSERSNLPITVFGVAQRPAELPLTVNYVQNPSQQQLAYLYRTHAVFISTSYREGWALPPAEAMASAGVFVGTDSGGCRDYAIPEQNALLSDPEDTSELLVNIARVLDDPLLRDRLQISGYKTLQDFTWELSTDALEAAFTRAAENHSANQI